MSRSCRSDEAVKVLQHSLLLGCDVWVPHHHQEDDSLSVGVIPCPMEIARIHAKKPSRWKSTRPAHVREREKGTGARGRRHRRAGRHQS